MYKRLVWILVSVAAVAVFAGASTRWLALPDRLEAVPAELTTQAAIPGIANARYWVAIDLDAMVQDVITARERERTHRASIGLGSELPPADLLAISGGGDKGAFGAGLLNGWTDAGTRPTFKAVTGVSTGALIAPFAFLGSEYDPVLREVYTSISPTDVSRPRNIAAAIRNDGMADNAPLWTLISEHVDQPLLDKIADEHRKGRIF